MSNAFSRSMGTPPTQMEQARKDQVVNNAGGYVFTVSPQARLERFLVLGTDGGTYYVDEKTLTKDNVQFLIELIEADEQMVIDTVVSVSDEGRAYRNTAAIFAVAALFRYGKQKSSVVMQKVCRTSTHLFQFGQFVELLGGWSRSTRRAVADWYRTKYENGTLSIQVVKYRQRDGWNHRDMFRLAHPVGNEEDWKTIGAFILDKDETTAANSPDALPLTIKKFKFAQEAQTLSEAKAMAPGLPWECFPTSFHKDVEFWKWLFANGQLTGQALVRNVTRLARLNAFNDMVFASDFAAKLADVEMIRQTRLHPIQYLLASVNYAEGQAQWTRYGNQKMFSGRQRPWVINSKVDEALEAGFYESFNYVEPASKRTLLALDVSGSMSSMAMGIDLSCSQVSAAMAMTFMRLEPYTLTMGFSNTFRDLGLSSNMALSAVMNKITGLTFGSTDCAQPMIWAGDNNIEVDTFVVLTDNETWSGRIHPFQALRAYRQKTSINAKLAVVGLAATPFTIADPTDRGMLDVVGGDTNLPKLITEFSAGRI